MKRISPKGIITAALISLILSLVAGNAIFLIAGGSFHHEGMSPDQINKAIRAVTDTTGFLVSALIAGTAVTVFGGYVAARVSKTNEYLNAGVFGVLGMVTGLILAADFPVWFNLLGLLMHLPAALFGGHLGRRSPTQNA